MIRRIWNLIGRILFWVSRPVIWIILAVGPPRTRVVVVRGDKVLLVKDWLGTGRWKLPGGGLRRKEDAQAGAVRELSEEVGLVIPEHKLQYLGRYDLVSSGARVRIQAYWVEVAPGVRAQVNGSEIIAGQWVKLEHAVRLPITESTQAVLTAFRDQSNLVQ